MSARNYMLSARDKNINKIIDTLPQINEQKHNHRIGRDIPICSANPNIYTNRNVRCSYTIAEYVTSNLNRSGSPYSDFFSESETGSPDIHSEESDSSAGSALNRNTAEATKTLAGEWERIERALYGEDGDKVLRPQMIEECDQWKKIHPQLRIVGKAIPLPEKKMSHRFNDREYDEVIAMHYSDYEQFSESEERLSQSSSDVTPQNSPRHLINYDLLESPSFIKLGKESHTNKQEDDMHLRDTFCSLLHITPVQIHSPFRKRQNPSILRSDLASSKWMRSRRPDSSFNYGRSSAKSYASLDVKTYKTISASDNSKIINGRVLTARQREMAKLEPLYTPEPMNEPYEYPNGSISHTRKVSLPPLFLEEDRKKMEVGSAKRVPKRKTIPRIERFSR